MSVSELCRRILFFYRRKRMAEDLEEEMRLHTELRANRLAEQGISSQEALYTARRLFGNKLLLEDVSREVWGWMWFERLLQDLHFAVRMLRKDTTFTMVAIATLALGAGANALMFTVIDSVLVRPLPYPDSQRLADLDSIFASGSHGSTSLPNFLDIRAQSRSFSAVAAYQEKSVSLRLHDGEPIHSSGVAASANLFDLLGIRPMLGHSFAPDQDQPGKPCSVIVSAEFWREHFAADPRALGQNLAVDGRACAISGVMPDGFSFPSRDDEFWIVLQPTPDTMQRGLDFLNVIARLKPSVPLATARVELNVIARRLASAYPDDNKDLAFGARLYQDTITGDARPALLALLGAVALLLLIACANIANLQLARSLGRKREMAIRAALGASRMRVARQLLTENLLLALLSTGIGVGLAAGSLGLLKHLAGDAIPRVQDIDLRPEVCLAMLIVASVSALLFGLAPVWQAARQDVETALRGTAGALTAGRHQQKFRDVLVVAQLSLALVLLAGSGLLIRTLYHLLHTDPGFISEHVLTLQTAVSGKEPVDKNLATTVYGPELEQIARIPGVKSTGFITFLPLSNGHASFTFSITGRANPNPESGPRASLNAASDDFFRALQIPLLRGRFFASTDALGKPRVAIVNDVLAERYFAGQDPIGKQITFQDPDSDAHPTTIIGVVRGSRQRALAKPPDAEVYLDFRQLPPATLWSQFLLKQIMSFVVRTSGDPATVANNVRHVIDRIDADQSVFHVETMEDVLSQSVRSRRVGAILLSVFAVLALFVAAAGLYGVLSFMVAQRKRDIAIRMALGALQSEIVRAVVGRALILYTIGLVGGLLGVIWCGHLLSNMLVGIQPWDPVALGITTVVLLFISFLAAWFPARRAVSVDPYVALRTE